MRPTLPLACCAAVLALSACEVTGPDTTFREPGILEYYQEQADVSAPAEVRAGQRFVVTIITHSPSSCVHKGETRANVRGATADISPIDIHHRGEGVSCAAVGGPLTHQAEISFASPGTATVRVHGMRIPSGEEITVTRTVTVRAS